MGRFGETPPGLESNTVGNPLLVRSEIPPDASQLQLAGPLQCGLQCRSGDYVRAPSVWICGVSWWDRRVPTGTPSRLATGGLRDKSCPAPLVPVWGSGKASSFAPPSPRPRRRAGPPLAVAPGRPAPAPPRPPPPVGPAAPPRGGFVPFPRGPLASHWTSVGREEREPRNEGKRAAHKRDGTAARQPPPGKRRGGGAGRGGLSVGRSGGVLPLPHTGTLG